MSMADIIMQGTARGLESRSRGMRDLSAGISKMGDMYTRKQERKEEQDIEEKKWQVKKKFMNAQAENQAMQTKATKAKMDEQVVYKANLKYIADNGLSDAKAEEYLNTHGSADLSTGWREGKEANDSAVLAQEINKLNTIAAKSKALQSNFASVTNEKEFQQARQYSTEQFQVDPLKDQPGTWQEQLKMLMGNTGTMQEVTAKKKEALRMANRGKTEKLVDAVHAARKSGDKLMMESTEKELAAQSRKVSAIADMKEMDLQKQQREEHGEFSANADATLSNYLGNELGVDAKSEGYSEITNHLIEQQKKGWTPERSKIWLENFVIVEQDEGWAPFGLTDGPTVLKVNELAPDPVSMRGGDVHSMAKQKAEAADIKDLGSASEKKRFMKGFKGKDKEAGWKRYLKSVVGDEYGGGITGKFRDYQDMRERQEDEYGEEVQKGNTIHKQVVNYFKD